MPLRRPGGPARGLPADTELAKAKAKGFDGKLVYVSLNNRVSQIIVLTVQSMLGAVGFEAGIEFAATTTDLIE